MSPLSRQPTLTSMDTVFAPDGGPSNAVKRVRESNIRRASIARSALAPMGPSEPRKRLSIVHNDDSEVFLDIRSRVNSLAPVPVHFERVETPDSVLHPVQRIIHASPPTFIQTVQKSPNQPVPRPSVFERHSHRRLSNAIEDLEDLVEEAVVTAERTEQPEHVEQLYAIIEDASIAAQDTSSEPARRLMRTSSPLQVATEEVSKFPSNLPTHLKAVKTIAEHVYRTPKTQLRNVEQRDSETIDWAYRSTKDPKHHHQHFRSSSSSSSSSSTSSTSSRSRDRRHSHTSSGSDLLQLLPPQPIATASRDHVDHVLRPIISRSHSRGRSRRRKGSFGHCRRRHRYDRSRRSDDTRSHSSHRRFHHHRSSDFDTSFDEEDLHAVGKLGDIKRNGEELHVRDAHHHTFSLRRNHRRQPVARNWRTGKKRFCAFIACANTAVLGIIVGIYVSSPLLTHSAELTGYC